LFDAEREEERKTMSLSVKEFSERVVRDKAIRQKLEDGVPLNADELAILDARPEAFKVCPSCEKPFGPRVDGEHHKIGSAEVCDDCYFTSMGDELEAYPIGRRGIRRRG
jgi:hypothetical protein